VAGISTERSLKMLIFRDLTKNNQIFKGKFNRFWPDLMFNTFLEKKNLRDFIRKRYLPPKGNVL
jgi:hypothetical protein